MSSRPLWVVVLAGGDGARLAHLTRAVAGEETPKQFCHLLGERSLLQATLERAALMAPPARTLVTVQRRHLHWAEQLRPIPPNNFVLQSCNRETGPGITACLLRLAERDPKALAVLMPSDHYVDDVHAFHQRVMVAVGHVAAHPADVALLGVRPAWSSPELGYVLPGEMLAPGVHRVARFVEKPARAWAERLIAQDALWNTLILVFSLPRMLASIEAIAPAELEACRRARDDRAFAALPPWNFSRNLLAGLQSELVVVRVDGPHWSDWGTPESIDRSLRLLGRRPPWDVGQGSGLGPRGAHATLRGRDAGALRGPGALSKR